MNPISLGKIDLISSRLYIHTYRQSDAKSLFNLVSRNRAMLADPMPITAGGNQSVLQTRNFIVSRNTERRAGIKSFAGIFLKKNNDLIGQIAIVSIDARVPKCEIGYFIDEKHHAKGYGTEAVKTFLAYLFDDLQMGKVHLRIEPGNLGSLGIAKKCGFTKCGFFRNEFRSLNGRLMHIECWELLREEYLAL